MAKMTCKSVEVGKKDIFDLVNDFLKDEAFSQMERTVRKYLKPDLVIIDGETWAAAEAMMRERVRKLAASGARDLDRRMRHALFHLEAGAISKRKELHLPV